MKRNIILKALSISLIFVFAMILLPEMSCQVKAVSVGDNAGTCTADSFLGPCGGPIIIIDIYDYPTCTEPGFGFGQCAVCAHGYDLTFPATGHNDIVTKQPTCTEEGTAKCSTCGRTVTLGKTEHSYGEEKIEEATCTEDGKGTKTCTVCGFESARVIYALGHKYEVVSEPTCTEEGKEVCSRCGDEIVHDKIGHDYEITEYIHSTCTEEGSITSVCSRCEDELVQVIPALGHKYSFTVIDPTCTEDGHKKGKCSRCGDVSETVLPALGHDYPDEWTVVEESTFTKEGLKIKKCRRCGDTLKEPIPKKSIWPVIFITVGGVGTIMGLYFGLKKIRAKKKLAEKASKLVKPKLEDKKIAVCVKDEYNEFIELLKSKPFLEVSALTSDEVSGIFEEGGPDLLILQIDNDEELSVIPEKEKESAEDEPEKGNKDDGSEGLEVALIISDELYGQYSEKLAGYKHIPELKSPNQGLVKLVLPVLKPDPGSDETLENIGIIADLLGIPVVSTLIDTYIGGRDIKATVEASEEFSISDTATIIADIASILGMDAVAGVAGLVDDVDKLKAAADKESGTHELKDGVKGTADIVDVVSDLIN